MSKCLYCYKEIEPTLDYHPECSVAFFGTKTSPNIEYSLEEMNMLAKQVIERSISVPGVQPKLSMSLFEGEDTIQRLTIVSALMNAAQHARPSHSAPITAHGSQRASRAAARSG